MRSIIHSSRVDGKDVIAVIAMLQPMPAWNLLLWNLKNDDVCFSKNDFYKAKFTQWSFLKPISRSGMYWLELAVSSSCLNNCTYCKTKHARGDLGSYQPEEIISRAKQAFNGQCGSKYILYPQADTIPS